MRLARRIWDLVGLRLEREREGGGRSATVIGGLIR